MTQESTTYPGNGVREAVGGEGLWVRLKEGGDETGESCFLKVDVLLKYFDDRSTPRRPETQSSRGSCTSEFQRG